MGAKEGVIGGVHQANRNIARCDNFQSISMECWRTTCRKRGAFVIVESTVVDRHISVCFDRCTDQTVVISLDVVQGDISATLDQQTSIVDKVRVFSCVGVKDAVGNGY